MKKKKIDKVFTLRIFLSSLSKVSYVEQIRFINSGELMVSIFGNKESNL